MVVGNTLVISKFKTISFDPIPNCFIRRDFRNHTKNLCQSSSLLIHHVIEDIQNQSTDLICPTVIPYQTFTLYQKILQLTYMCQTCHYFCSSCFFLKLKLGV
ncbi:unnamed protein product [Prunus armeniaca]